MKKSNTNNLIKAIIICSSLAGCNPTPTFIRDTSHSELGEAYRDSSGLIWGSPVMKDGELLFMTEADANIYCQNIGARLPKVEEFAHLYGVCSSTGGQIAAVTSTYCYSPYKDGTNSKEELLPGLISNLFWTSDLSTLQLADGTSGEYSYAFAGDDGTLRKVWTNLKTPATRCVAR